MPSIKPNSINHVAIPIVDRKKSITFYREVAGLELVPSMVDNPRIIWTRTADGTMVHLVESNDGVPITPHIAFEVDDFDATIAAIRERDIEIVSGPAERHDGQRYVFILDPDGNRVEFTTPSGLKPHNRVCDEWGYTKPA